MKCKASRLFSILISVLLLISIECLSTTSASASTGGESNVPDYCKPAVTKNLFNLKYQPFGTEIPVILVHRLGGKGKNQWGAITNPTDFITKLDAISDVGVAAQFEYDTVGPGDLSFQDHPRPLAQAIDCMAEISRRNGGPGKVIVVGYSEGAAITRKALKQSVSGRAIVDEVGQVVTIADASHYFPAPKIADTIVVHAIAGDVTVQKYDKHGNPTTLRDTESDDTIRTKWATWQYSENISQGGGSTVVKCVETSGGGNSQIPTSDTGCHHGALLNNSNVQNDAIGAIMRYVSFLNPTSEPYHTWNHGSGLTLRLPDNQWDEIVSAFGDPSINGTAFELGTSKYLMLLPFSDFCTTDPELSCTLNPNFVVTGHAPTVAIGGRTPDLTLSYTETNHTSTDMWCFSTEGVCVYYRNGPSADQLEPSPALLDVFASATWA